MINMIKRRLEKEREKIMEEKLVQTSEMIEYAARSHAEKFIICTEMEIFYNWVRKIQVRNFIP